MEREERGLDVIFLHLSWKLCIEDVMSMSNLLLFFSLDIIYRHYALEMALATLVRTALLTKHFCIWPFFSFVE